MAEAGRKLEVRARLNPGSGMALTKELAKRMEGKITRLTAGGAGGNTGVRVVGRLKNEGLLDRVAFA